MRKHLSMAARLRLTVRAALRRHRPKNREEALPVAQERTARRLKGGPGCTERGRSLCGGVNGTGHGPSPCVRTLQRIEAHRAAK